MSYFRVKIVNSVQYTHRILAFGWPLNKRVWSEPTKSFTFGGVKLANVFWWREYAWSLPNCNLLRNVMYISSNHTSFLDQFGNNLHFVCFSKSSNCIRHTGSCNLMLLKNPLVQSVSKLSKKSRMITLIHFLINLPLFETHYTILFVFCAMRF